MQTVTVEIERTGKSYDHTLSPATVYKGCCQNQPPVDFSIASDQATIDKFKAMLRYDTEEKLRQESISFFQDLMTKVLNDIEPLRIEANRRPEEALHVRLLMEARELVQLPFELALTPKGIAAPAWTPFLLNLTRIITLTREVKQVKAPSYEWPYQPRILFAYAQPKEEVPFAEHFSVLRDIVKELVLPDTTSPEPVANIPELLTVLKNASLSSITATINSAVANGKPYTHVHVLAHGSQAGNAIIPGEFSIALHHDTSNEEAFYATGIDLARAIIALEGETGKAPAIVSLMVCDSSNTGNVSLPAGSVAHQLHETGIPCVFASQFPLTVDGSVKLVKALYEKLLFDGDDPRKALYHTRRALVDKQTHDWASLVAYVRFPENIDEQLKDYRLNVLLESLKTSNAWAEHVLKFKDKMSPEKFATALENISKRLDKSINDLTRLFKNGTDVKVNKARYAEHAGLMGSAYKRKAEHLFRLASFNEAHADAMLKNSRDMLKTSRDWYFVGFKEHRLSHWTAIQYLSLAAIIEGNLHDEEKKEIWIVTKYMAVDDTLESRPAMSRIWAWGTLIELYLLKPLTVPTDAFDKDAASAFPKAKEYATTLANATSTFINDESAKREKIVFAQESTTRQLERYISWWPVMFSSPQLEKIKNMAIELREVLMK